MVGGVRERDGEKEEKAMARERGSVSVCVCLCLRVGMFIPCVSDECWLNIGGWVAMNGVAPGCRMRGIVVVMWQWSCLW